MCVAVTWRKCICASPLRIHVRRDNDDDNRYLKFVKHTHTISTLLTLWTCAVVGDQFIYRRVDFQTLNRLYIGRIRLSVSTVNRAYELSGITHVTLFPKYGKHSTGPSTYGPWVRTYSKSFSCKPVLTVCNYRAQSNEILTYGEVSRGSVPRVRRYGLLYLRAVEYVQLSAYANR